MTAPSSGVDGRKRGVLLGSRARWKEGLQGIGLDVITNIPEVLKMGRHVSEKKKKYRGKLGRNRLPKGGGGKKGPLQVSSGGMGSLNKLSTLGAH